MARILRTARAEEDYREIWDFVARDDPTAADRLLRKFDEKLQLCVTNPGMGTLRERYAPGLRSIPVGNYVLFYRPAENGIELIRVLHGARNFNRIFRK